MKVLLYARSSTSDPKEIYRQLDTLRRSLAAEDSAAGLYYDVSPSGPAGRLGLVQALTLLSAGQVEEVRAQSLDRLARTRAGLDELRELLDRNGLALKLLGEDTGDQQQGGR